MNDSIWLGIVILVVAIAVLFIVLYFTSQISMVRPSECSSSTGTYGVRPNKTGTVVKSLNNLTLGEAIIVCDEDPSCNLFSYDCVGKSMYILDATKPIVDAVILDLYQSRIQS